MSFFYLHPSQWGWGSLLDDTPSWPLCRGTEYQQWLVLAEEATSWSADATAANCSDCRLPFLSSVATSLSKPVAVCSAVRVPQNYVAE